MKRLTRDEVEAERLLRRARSVAVLGAAASRGERDHAVASYLKRAGFDVFPVRADRAEVAGLAAWRRLADVPGSIDVVVVAAGHAPDEATIAEAARKGARGLWLSPGVAVGDAERQAAAHGLRLIRDRDVVAKHRHTERVAGEPRKRGVNVGGRDARTLGPKGGYVAGGGGGSRGGGGGRAVLDEKKMTGGKPSPRRHGHTR
jgi:hypothetical protein